MKKKRILTGLLLVSVAALSFAACGKKKDKQTTSKITTKAKTTTKATTTKKAEEKQVSSLYCSKQTGIIAMDIRSYNNSLEYVTIMPYAYEGTPFPIYLKPIVSNGKITGVKADFFVDTEDSSAFFTKTITLTDKGIEIPTSLRVEPYESGFGSDARIFVEKDGDGVCIYNNRASITVYADGSYESTDYQAATSSFYSCGLKVSHKDDIYTVSMDDMMRGLKYNVCMNPENSYVDMGMYSTYLKKDVAIYKYTTDVTSSNPEAIIYMNSSVMMGSGGMSLDDLDPNSIFTEGVLTKAGSLKTEFDAKGNVIKTIADMMGSSDDIEYEYNDKNQLVSVFLSDYEGKAMKYTYTYDDNGRVATFIRGYIDDNGAYKTAKSYGEYAFTYFASGYIQDALVRDIDDNGVEEKTKLSYVIDTKKRIASIQEFNYNTSSQQYESYAWTTFDYDANSNVINKKYDVEETITGWLSKSYNTDFTYNTNNVRTSDTKNLYINEEYDEYASEITTYVYDTNNKTYTETYTLKDSDGKTTETNIKSYKYSDADMKYLIESKNETIYEDGKTEYTKSTITYNSDNQASSVIAVKKKKNSTTETTLGTITFNYENKIIKTKVVVDNSENETKTSTFNAKGYLTDYLSEGTKKYLTTYTYDEDNYMTRSDQYVYINETIGYVYDTEGGDPSTMLLDKDHQLIPYGAIMYSYDSSYNLEYSMTFIFYDMMKGTYESQTLTYYNAKELPVSEVISNYLDDKNNSLDNTVTTTYTYDTDEETLLSFVELKKNKDDKLVSESGEEYYASNVLKETYTKLYEDDGVTVKSGSRFTYTDATPQVETEYVWDPTIGTDGDWKLA